MKILIPPVLFLLCIAGMFAAKRLIVPQTIIDAPYNRLGIGLVALGFCMIAYIGLLLIRRRTEIHTFHTPRKLVTEGLFRYSRNPIYLGFTIALIGVSVYLGNWLSFIGVLIFWLVANFWYIPFEEKQMLMQFGKEYQSYKAKVSRWI